MSVGVIIPAAGLGKRMKSQELKPYMMMKGSPIFLHTLNVFDAHPEVDEIIVVVREEEIQRTRDVIEKRDLKKVKQIIAGGKERQDSVFYGLKHITKEYVLVHDAVRPFVTCKEITSLLEKVREHKAVVLAIPVKNTIKVIEESGIVKNTLDRNQLREILTPQAFCKELLFKAHLTFSSINPPATDDAMLVEMLDVPVHVVDGEHTNIKITTPEDLLLAKLIYELRGVFYV